MRSLRKCANIPGRADHKAPDLYFDRKFHRSINKYVKANAFEDREHKRNLACLKKKIEEANCTVNRKKSKINPMNNPVRFFRSNADDADKIGLHTYKKKCDQMIEK